MTDYMTLPKHQLLEMGTPISNSVTVKDCARFLTIGGTKDAPFLIYPGMTMDDENETNFRSYMISVAENVALLRQLSKDKR